MWAQDEMRLGLKPVVRRVWAPRGQRPSTPFRRRYEWLVLDRAGWHTGKEVEIPEGIHLEFLPARSPELQPAERLWPLANEAVANRLFEDLDELEEALVERCISLLEQSDLIRSLTLYHWWPDAA